MKHGTFFGYFESENNRPGAQENLLEVLKKYKMETTAMQETKWQGKEIRDTKSYTVLYNGKEKGRKELSTAFIVHRSIGNNLKHNILDFQPIKKECVD